MENQNRRPLLLELAASWCAEKLKLYRIPAISGMIFGLLAYMFAFTNKLVNHDDVSALFTKGGTFNLGRWGLAAIDMVLPNYSMPWIYGIFTIMLITVAACVIIHIFSIRSKVFQILLVGSILVFPSLIGTLTYMFTCCPYAVSFLLSVLAVCFMVRQDKRFYLPALVCMIGSLSIYQSYVAVAASLLVLTLIQRLLKEESVDSIVRSGILYVLFLIVSLGMYYGMTMVINRLRGVNLNSYATSNLSFSIAEIPARILMAYRNFPRFFTEGFRGLMPTSFSRLLHTLSLAVSGLLLLLWGSSRKELKASRIFWLIALLGILPLAINCMYLFSTEDSVHTLVLYGFTAFYVLAVVLAEITLDTVPENLFRRIGVNAMSLLLTLIIAGNTYLANQTFLMLHLRYENAHSFYTALVADIRMTPEFDKNTKLAITGTYQEQAFYLEKFPYSDYIPGADGFLPDVYSKDSFMEYYIGVQIPWATDGEITQITATAEYQQMPVYPYYGSLKKIGDILVVKLS